MVHIDTESVGGWCHLVATTIDELHTFAQSIGLKRCWFQNKRDKNKRSKNQPHYDVRGVMIQKAIDKGAVRVQRAELWTFLKSNYGNLFINN